MTHCRVSETHCQVSMTHCRVSERVPNIVNCRLNYRFLLQNSVSFIGFFCYISMCQCVVSDTYIVCFWQVYCVSLTPHTTHWHIHILTHRHIDTLAHWHIVKCQRHTIYDTLTHWHWHIVKRHTTCRVWEAYTTSYGRIYTDFLTPYTHLLALEQGCAEKWQCQTLSSV